MKIQEQTGAREQGTTPIITGWTFIAILNVSDSVLLKHVAISTKLFRSCTIEINRTSYKMIK